MHATEHRQQNLDIHLIVAALAFLSLTLGTVQAAEKVAVTGVVPANCPAQLPAPLAIPCASGPAKDVVLTAHVKVGTNPEQVLPAQFEPADAVSGTPARAWIIWSAGAKDDGQPISVSLQAGPAADTATATPNAYQSKKDAAQLYLTTREGKPVLSYWHGEPAKNQKYPLTDFVHPVMGLDGEVLTDKSPRDHLHHRGIFWSWVRHERNGKSLGTWWIPDTIHLEAHGEPTTTDGPVFSRFSAQHDWIYQAKDGSETTPILREQVVCKVFETTTAGRAMDFDITLNALVDGLSLSGTEELNKGYGGLTFRYAPVVDRKQVQVVFDGKTLEYGKDVIQGKAKWADWSATFKMPDGSDAKGRSGAAIFVDPGHPDYPPEWLTRFYGVLNVSYPGLKMLPMPKGKPLRLQYRIWIHRGDAREGHVQEEHSAYVSNFHWKTADAQ